MKSHIELKFHVPRTDLRMVLVMVKAFVLSRACLGIIISNIMIPSSQHGSFRNIKKPTIMGSILGPMIFGNSHMAVEELPRSRRPLPGAVKAAMGVGGAGDLSEHPVQKNSRDALNRLYNIARYNMKSYKSKN